MLERYFKPYFEDRGYQKVFHNYAFDSHMLRRHGIILQGFHADTLHMARLYDTSRASWEGQVKAKAKLGWTGDLAGAASPPPPPPPGLRCRPAPPSGRAVPAGVVLGVRLGKTPLPHSLYAGQSTVCTLPTWVEDVADDGDKEWRMSLQGYGLKSLAAHFRLPAGPGNFATLFGTSATAGLEAHNSPERFAEWAHYAASDAVMAHSVFERLRSILQSRPWHSSVHRRPMHELLTCPWVAEELRRGVASTLGSQQYSTGLSMWELYKRYIRDLGECLADLERTGVAVDLHRLQEMEHRTSEQLDLCCREFATSLASVEGPDGRVLNPDAAYINIRSSIQLRTLLFGGTHMQDDPSQVLDVTKEFPAPRGAPKKRVAVQSLGLSPSGRKKDLAASGWPSTSSEILQELAGDPRGGKSGTARGQLLRNGFKPEHAELAVHSLRKLSEASRIKHIVTGFVKPLLEYGRAATGRIHPSWGWDTSTGRLACRTPNLQNLPSARSSDTSHLRDAFRPGPGNVFVIADYSQLELRVLAHVADCSSMIQKLTWGGDYHSEVAAEMFPHVHKAIEAGEVVTNETEGSDKPTVKDVFRVERSKAKAVNFGIIYGMGACTLSESLAISQDEARELIKLWLSTKPEVQYLTNQIEKAVKETQCSASIIGRQRHLPFASVKADPAYRAKSLRAAVNFAIQGSSADIVLAAMLQLWRHPWLKTNGFRIVMQIHDEFVLEGPEELGHQAAEVVREVMMRPFREYNESFEFKVPLLVDVSVGRSFGGDKP